MIIITEFYHEKGETYGEPFTRVFLRLAGELEAPEPGAYIRLQNVGQKKNRGEQHTRLTLLLFSSE